MKYTVVLDESEEGFAVVVQELARSSTARQAEVEV